MMKRIAYCLLTSIFLYSFSGCKPDPKPDLTDYYIKFRADSTDQNFDIAKNDAQHPVNVSYDNVGDHHYFQGDYNSQHIHFGFVDDIKNFSIYTGGTYKITRMDYGNGVGFGSYLNIPETSSETYETDYGVDTGTLTVSYNPGNNQLSGTFSFRALQTNPQPNKAPKTVNITNGSFLIRWFPY
jgi:hypothetical protein